MHRNHQHPPPQSSISEADDGRLNLDNNDELSPEPQETLPFYPTLHSRPVTEHATEQEAQQQMGGSIRRQYAEDTRSGALAPQLAITKQNEQRRKQHAANN